MKFKMISLDIETHSWNIGDWKSLDGTVTTPLSGLPIDLASALEICTPPKQPFSPTLTLDTLHE